MKPTSHPAYWGSLLSIFVVCIVAIIDHIYIRSEYEISAQGGSVLYAVISASLCVLFCCRYYLAVSTNIYSGENRTILNLPGPLSITIFIILSVLITLCNFMIAAVGLYGPVTVLKYSFFAVLISLFVSLVLFVGNQFRPKTISHAPALFIVVDLFLIAGILAFHLLHPSEASDEELAEFNTWAGMLMAASVVMISHEFWKLFFQPLVGQFADLRSDLS